MDKQPQHCSRSGGFVIGTVPTQHGGWSAKSWYHIYPSLQGYESLQSSIQGASIPSQTEPWLHTKTSGIC